MATIAVVRTSVAAATAQAAAAPLEAGRPRHDAFDDQSEPWRSYFRAARAAGQHADPLRRCLEYPDLPDADWPLGYAGAHCHYPHGRVPPSGGTFDAATLRAFIAEADPEDPTDGPRRTPMAKVFEAVQNGTISRIQVHFE